MPRPWRSLCGRISRRGSYTATYRVVSADSHPVSGGFVFTVGDGGAAPAAAVADLVDRANAGPGTDVAFGAAKAVSYAAIALAVGGLLFVVAVWLPALRHRAASDDSWRLASEAFAERLGIIGWIAVAMGVAGSAAGIVLQGATAAGTSAFEALSPNVIGDVLSTRFGTVWGLRLLDWLALGGLLALLTARRSLPALRPASLGATGLALPAGARPSILAPLALLLGFLVVSPALAGHAGASDPRLVLVSADVVHVLGDEPVDRRPRAAPAGAARRHGPARARRPHPPAGLLPVPILAARARLGGRAAGHRHPAVDPPPGIAVRPDRHGVRPGDPDQGVAGAGADRPRRPQSPPFAAAIARDREEGGPPGREGRLLRNTLRTEVALLATVLAVTAALTSYPPPDSLAQGPFSTTSDLGAARMELTVEPARPGANEIHLYLSDPRTGAQYDRLRDVTVALRLPDKRIGPLEPRVDKAGPGHWVARRAQVAPAGDWDLTVSGRVSEFEEARALVEVPVR